MYPELVRAGLVARIPPKYKRGLSNNDSDRLCEDHADDTRDYRDSIYGKDIKRYI